jgi:hypothetical protein
MNMNPLSLVTIQTNINGEVSYHSFLIVARGHLMTVLRSLKLGGI